MCFLEVQPQMIFPNEITCKDTECLLGESSEIKCFSRCQKSPQDGAATPPGSGAGRCSRAGSSARACTRHLGTLHFQKD